MLYLMDDAPLPDVVRPRPGRPARGVYKGPVPELRIISRKATGFIFSEVGEVVFRCKDPGLTDFGLRVGVRYGQDYHWWEWVRIEELWRGPVCAAYRIGGYVDVKPETDQYYEQLPSILKSEWLHNQHWIFGEAYVVCFSNGVIRMTCRHVNNHRFDEGREQRDVTPVIALNVRGVIPFNQALDGKDLRFNLGGLELSLAEAAALISPEHPGRIGVDDGLVIYQPYEGFEAEGDHAHRAREDGFLVKAEERRMPRGIARTVRFDLSMGACEPEVARYAAPSWWYAMAGDLWPDDALPVHDDWDERIDNTAETGCVDHPGRFDEAVLGRAWEGESPYAEFLYFYRTGKKRFFNYALRDAYHIADIAFDHATETIRMHDYPLDGTSAPPLFRTVGLTFGYLETGDPYLLECSESAAVRYYWMDRHNWPRRSYGRDGASLRSLAFLWDYTGKEDYLDMMREALGRLIQCQLPDGSYRDQGGGTGIHATGQLVKKVWMACLATDPIIDYLQRRPGDEALEAALLKTGQFVLDAFIEAGGERYWAYEYEHGDMSYDPVRAKMGHQTAEGFPSGRSGHGHKARMLCFLSRLTGNPDYFVAWQKFFDSQWKGKDVPAGNYHTINKTLQHLPYAQAHQWNARWREGGLELSPFVTPQVPSIQGTIDTPVGLVAATFASAPEGKAVVSSDAPRGLRVRVELPGGRGVVELVGVDKKTI